VHRGLPLTLVGVGELDVNISLFGVLDSYATRRVSRYAGKAEKPRRIAAGQWQGAGEFAPDGGGRQRASETATGAFATSAAMANAARSNMRLPRPGQVDARLQGRRRGRRPSALFVLGGEPPLLASSLCEAGEVSSEAGMTVLFRYGPSLLKRELCDAGVERRPRRGRTKFSTSSPPRRRRGNPFRFRVVGRTVAAIARSRLRCGG